MNQLASLLKTNVINLLAKSGALVLAFLVPIHELLIAVGVFVACDLATGLYKAYKTKDPITSSRLRSTVSKLLAYQFAIILCYVLEKYMIPDVPATKIVATLISGTELVSINENLYAITGLDVFKAIMAKLELFKLGKGNE